MIYTGSSEFNFKNVKGILLFEIIKYSIENKTIYLECSSFFAERENAINENYH